MKTYLNHFTALSSMRYVAAFLVMVVIHACGGSDNPAVTPITPPVSDIDRGGVAIGSIDGFGSIIVNGVRFDVSNASITVDGEPSSENDLDIGDVVEVEATFDSNGTTGTASAVTANSLVEGPITTIDSVNQQLTVLGQIVVVTVDTLFDDSIVPASFAGLTLGLNIEVHGVFNGNGNVVATRIEIDNNANEFELVGIISNLDLSAQQFDINTQRVFYGNAMLDDFDGANPASGDRVEVKGTSFGSNQELIATKVEKLGAGNDAPGDDGDRIEVEGFITRYGSSSDFDVAGIAVTTTSGTVYEGGSATDLTLNTKVEVEGDINSSGTIVATKIEIKQANSVRVYADVESVNATTGSITALGITFLTNLSTRFEDKSDADVENLRINDIAIGDRVEMRGFLLASGLVAERVEREDPDNEVELQGFVEIIADPDFTIFGVTVQTQGGTTFRAADDSTLSSSAFFSQLSEGDLVEAKGSLTSGPTIIAEEVEFEDE